MSNIMWVASGNVEGWGVLVFFFQEEDGIRGSPESRGVGDVYRRKVCVCVCVYVPIASRRPFRQIHSGTPIACFYAHLTLSTDRYV